MPGVSIITCTHVPYYMENIFANYGRQSYYTKEFIVVLNNSALALDEWQSYAKKLNLNNIRIFIQPESITVGSCMNFAVNQARFEYIANFDHDDYYGTKYLNDFINVAPYKKNAGLFGKKSHYVYLEEDGTLAIMHPGFENNFVDYVDGPTMFMKKSIFNKVKFIDNDISDCQFSLDCQRAGIKIYSVNRFHFAYIRKKDTDRHTWKINNHELIDNHCRILGKVEDYKPVVDV